MRSAEANHRQHPRADLQHSISEANRDPGIANGGHPLIMASWEELDYSALRSTLVHRGRRYGSAQGPKVS